MSRLGYNTLYDRDGLSVLVTSWRRDQHPACSRVDAPAAAVEFMRHGSYLRRGRWGDELVDATTAAFFQPGESFIAEHPLGESNAGTTLRIAPQRLAEIGGAATPRGPERRVVVPTLPAVHLAQQRLVAWLTTRAVGGVADPLVAEESTLGLLRAAFAARGCDVAGRPPTATQRSAVQTAREFLLAHLAEPIALADVAAAAGLSRWHLCRSFAAVTGRSIHRYRTELRLRRALAEIAGGQRDLTGLALACGFSIHAHLTDLFRRAFGAAPRDVRSALRGGVPGARG